MLVSQSVLTVSKVSKHDYGEYKCHARNSLGITEDSVSLDVTSPPDQPIDFEAYNKTHDSVTLIWKKGFDGGLPTSYRVRWREALDRESRYRYVDISPDDYKATIAGLSLDTFYVFSIQAINEKGESPFLPDMLKVQTLSEYELRGILDCPFRYLEGSRV